MNEKLRLVVVDVALDGNCMFRAVSLWLYGEENQH